MRRKSRLFKCYAENPTNGWYRNYRLSIPREVYSLFPLVKNDTITAEQLSILYDFIRCSIGRFWFSEYQIWWDGNSIAIAAPCGSGPIHYIVPTPVNYV